MKKAEATLQLPPLFLLVIEKQLTVLIYLPRT